MLLAWVEGDDLCIHSHRLRIDTFNIQHLLKYQEAAGKTLQYKSLVDLEPRTNLDLKKQLAQMQDFMQDVGVIATAPGFLRRFTRASGQPVQGIKSY